MSRPGSGSATPRSPRPTSWRSPTPQGVPRACRLVVRRVARLGGLGGRDAEENRTELFTAWRYHAFIANSTLTCIDADITHRGYAIVEQAIAELEDGPLAHLPLGRYAANAAWLACAVIAFNLARVAAVAAGMARAR